MKFINKFAHSSNYGGTRKLSDIKYIVVHFTGNKGDTALNNCKYFQGPNRHASAHCFIDGSGVVYKSVSLKRVAWAVGGCYTLKNGAGSKYKVATNANSLSIISTHTPTKGATAILTNNFLIFCSISLIISILYLKIIQILFLFRYKFNFLSHILSANLLLFLCLLYTRITIKSMADQLVFLYLHQNVLL